MFSTVTDEAKLTIDDLIEREPCILGVLDAAWGQGMQEYVTYKRVLETLVGWNATTEDNVLKSEKAYSIALAALSNTLHKVGPRWRAKWLERREYRPPSGPPEATLTPKEYKEPSGDLSYECWQGYRADGTVDYFTSSNGVDHRKCDWRRRDATAKQKQFLKPHGKWYDGMRLGEASDKVFEIFKADCMFPFYIDADLNDGASKTWKLLPCFAGYRFF